MKYLCLVFMYSHTILLCIDAQIGIGNGHSKLFRRFMISAPMKKNSESETSMEKEEDIYKIFQNSRHPIWGQYSPFFSYKPKFVPISFYGKRSGDVFHMLKSKYYLKNADNNKIEYEKRSVSSAVVRSDDLEYQALLRTLNMLRSATDSELYNINNYDDGLQRMLELLPPLSDDRLEHIRSLLNSMIKRRFGSWGGRKRSEFYSWGGRKKRGQLTEDSRAENNRLIYLQGMEETEKRDPFEDIELNSYEDENTALPATDKRHNDFYPWGGKRTLPPPFPQY